MIVYNVARKWFAMKDDAERQRKTEGLRPSATRKVEITTREELALFLNALCEVSPTTVKTAQAALPDNPLVEIVDQAYVAPEADISQVPNFLLKGKPEHADELKHRERGGSDVFG